MTDPTIDVLRRLDPTAAADPAQAVSADSRGELLTRIMQADGSVMDAREAGARRGGVAALSEESRRRPFWTRRAVPALVAAGAATAITFSVVGLPGGDRHEALGQALSFTDEGNFLRVKVIDPQADSARYNAEFKERHLDITLSLVPASPSVVGTETAYGLDGGSNPIRSTGDPAGCVEAHSYPCVPTFLVPKNYKGTARFEIGRAAAPGEQIQAGGAIDAHGEALEGVRYKNLTVAKVVAILAKRGYTVPEYRVAGADGIIAAQKQVPSTWFVSDGFLHVDKQVVLFASPKR